MLAHLSWVFHTPIDALERRPLWEIQELQRLAGVLNG